MIDNHQSISYFSKVRKDFLFEIRKNEKLINLCVCVCVLPAYENQSSKNNLYPHRRTILGKAHPSHGIHGFHGTES